MQLNLHETWQNVSNVNIDARNACIYATTICMWMQLNVFTGDRVVNREMMNFESYEIRLAGTDDLIIG